jgi:hypothetical protein
MRGKFIAISCAVVELPGWLAGRRIDSQLFYSDIIPRDPALRQNYHSKTIGIKRDTIRRRAWPCVQDISEFFS